MRQIREVLRLKHATKYSHTVIAQHCNIGRTSVREYLYRAAKAGLSWPLPADMDDAQLEDRLFPQANNRVSPRPTPNWGKVHQELKRKHVTLFLLWEEYKTTHPEGFQYSRFCDKYRQWLGRCDVVMRQDHRAGEKCFVDYAGHTIDVVNKTTGEIQTAQIFVAVLGASNYTFAEATWSQSLKDWIGTHVRAFRFFGGVSSVIIPDNLRSAVTKAHRYEPLLNTSYQNMAEHYNTCVVPARVRKPKDKAKAEGGVLLVERWILARLRDQKYFTLHDLNADISTLLTYLNQRRFKKLEGTRESLFQSLERPVLQPLPHQPYVFAEWLKVRLAPNCHVEVKQHFYSAPHALLKRQLDARLTEYTVELFHKGARVASHVRDDTPYHYTTDKTHLPKRHQAYADRSPEHFGQQASKIGLSTFELIQTVLQSRPHPQQAYNSCFGILALAKDYGESRLEAACRRALVLGSNSYRSIASILKHDLDQQPLPEPAPSSSIIEHDNVRGAAYYTVQ